MYAMEDPDKLYPPVAPYDDLWIFETKAMYPEYLSDLSILVSPDDPDSDELVAELKAMQETGEFDWERVARIAAKNFVYAGWAVTSLDQIPELAERRRGVRAEVYNSNLVNDDGDLLFHRMNDEVERFFVTDQNDPGASAKAQSEIFLMFETLRAGMDKREKGGNVLFSDGHVEYLKLTDLEQPFNAVYPDGVPENDRNE
jgi:prepilin-type processing-associated H-X9-DG protein